MTRRLRLTCEVCGSFLHETKKCKKNKTMKLVQTVYILKKDKWEQSKKQSRKPTTTSSKTHTTRHPKGPALLPTKKGRKNNEI